MQPNTINELISGYMRTAESFDLAESTRKQKIGMFREIAEICNSIKDFDVNKYRLYLFKKGLKKTSINDYIKMIRPIFNWAIYNEYLEDDPFRDIKNFKIPRKRIKVYSPCQIEAILAVSNDLWQARILASVTAGMRPTEYLNLTYDDVDFANNEITIQPKDDTEYTWEWSTKNYNYRKVPLSQRLRDILMKIIPNLFRGQQYLMLTSARQKNLLARKPLPYSLRRTPDMNVKPWKKIVKEANKQLGERDQIKNLTIYNLRKTCITLWSQNPNLSPQEVQELAGHADIATTMEYYAAVRTDVCQRANTPFGATGLEPATS